MLRLLIVVITLSLAANACEGDCMVCHPGLEKMKGKEASEHRVLRSCKNCHKKPMKESNATAECGRDCWECHDIRRVQSLGVKAHEGLGRCIECHVTLDRDLLRGGSLREKIY